MAPTISRRRASGSGSGRVGRGSAKTRGVRKVGRPRQQPSYSQRSDPEFVIDLRRNKKGSGRGRGRPAGRGKNKRGPGRKNSNKTGSGSVRFRAVRGKARSSNSSNNSARGANANENSDPDGEEGNQSSSFWRSTCAIQ